jgi:hypothetical protein
MPTLEEISAKADELQAVVDREQQQIADLRAQNQATIDTLNQTIAQLQAEGGTDAGRQAVIDKLEILKADVEATVNPGGNGESPAGDGTDNPNP